MIFRKWVPESSAHISAHQPHGARHSVYLFDISNQPIVKCWIKAKPHLLLIFSITWWRHQMETFSALLAICAGNSPVPGDFPAQRPVTRRFDVFFDLRLNKRLSKQSWGWWFDTLSCSLWRHRNVYFTGYHGKYATTMWFCFGVEWTPLLIVYEHLTHPSTHYV